MSNASENTTASGVAKDDADWIGTLKRGASFTLGVHPDTSQRFLKGIDYPLDEATKLKLEEKAVEQIDTGDEDEDGLIVTEGKCKFDFRTPGTAAKVAAPRRRVRAG